MMGVMIIIIFEIAAIVGSIWSRKALNIVRVNVGLSPPNIVIATTTSSMEVKKASNAQVMMAKRICGTVMVRNAFQRGAPRALGGADKLAGSGRGASSCHAGNAAIPETVCQGRARRADRASEDRLSGQSPDAP